MKKDKFNNDTQNTDNNKKESQVEENQNTQVEEQKEPQVEENQDNQIENQEEPKVEENQDNQIENQEEPKIEENQDNQIENQEEPKIEENQDNQIESQEENYQELADNYYNNQENKEDYQNVQNSEQYDKYENYYLDEDREFDYRSYMSIPRESIEDVISEDYENEDEEPKVDDKKEKKKKKKKCGTLKIVLISLLTSMIVCVASSYCLVSAMLYMREKDSKNVAPAFKTYKNITIEEKSSELISEVAEKAGPSVVGIRATVLTRDFFFGVTESNPEGSGIIFRENGYILTNNHVIESALVSNTNNLSEGCKIEVILPSKKDDKYVSYEAKVVGRDTRTDLAVLKIEAEDLETATFANSDNVRVGEVAVAIGNPGGLEYMGSVTSGIVSGLNRTVEIGNGRQIKLIQTDAAINPGNSGGALVNSKGEVIGVNTVKIAGSNYEGLGFAIPSNIVKEVVESLVEFNYVKGRPALGVKVDLRYTEEVAKQYKLPVGVYVASVELLSAAERAGIERGDIITEFGGVKIKNFDELVNEKNKYVAGDEVEVKVYKIEQEKTVTLTMKLGEDFGTMS